MLTFSDPEFLKLSETQASSPCGVTQNPRPSGVTREDAIDNIVGGWGGGWGIGGWGIGGGGVGDEGVAGGPPCAGVRYKPLATPADAAMAATITGNITVRARGSSRAAASVIANPASTPVRIHKQLFDTDTPAPGSAKLELS
jgi:hypothetical protein